MPQLNRHFVICSRCGRSASTQDQTSGIFPTAQSIDFALKFPDGPGDRRVFPARRLRLILGSSSCRFGRFCRLWRVLRWVDHLDSEGFSAKQIDNWPDFVGLLNDLVFVLRGCEGFEIPHFGYRLGRVKIVGLDGQAPSSKSLIWRALFGLIGLLYFLHLFELFNYMRALFGVLAPLSYLDLIWLLNDTHRQALRDKFAGTYVVKKDAQPAGKGRIVFRLHVRSLFTTSCFERLRREWRLSRLIRLLHGPA